MPLPLQNNAQLTPAFYASSRKLDVEQLNTASEGAFEKGSMG